MNTSLKILNGTMKAVDHFSGITDRLEIEASGQRQYTILKGNTTYIRSIDFVDYL